MDPSHLQGLAAEAGKSTKHSLSHKLKVYVKFLIFCIVSFCAALCMLGISVSFIRLMDHFMGINQTGLEYLKANLTSIGVALGSLGTCLALYYKANFMKLAHTSFYENSICYCIFGWTFICFVYLSVVFLCTWCLNMIFFYASSCVAGIFVIGTPIASYFRYKPPETKPVQDKTSDQEKKDLNSNTNDKNDSKNADNKDDNGDDATDLELGKGGTNATNATNVKQSSSTNKSSSGDSVSSTSHKSGKTNTGTTGGRSRSSSFQKIKENVDLKAFKHAFMDIFAVLVSAVSLGTGVVIIVVSLVEIQANVWTWDETCRGSSAFEEYFTDILTSIFLMASSLTRLTSHTDQFQANGKFQYIVYALVGLPCLYFTSVIAYSA